MSRDISAANLTEINAAHLHQIIMVKLEFDTPLYIHSGIGTIIYNANSYLGVGQFGNVSNMTETEVLRPTSLTLSLSGVDSNLITEALDSGDYGDVITIYNGYRQDDGTLVADPLLIWRGFFDFASISQGDQSIVSITVQHDLAILNEIDGSRFTDEDQQVRFSGDIGFEYVADMAGLKLLWGGRVVIAGESGFDRDLPGVFIED